MKYSFNTVNFLCLLVLSTSTHSAKSGDTVSFDLEPKLVSGDDSSDYAVGISYSAQYESGLQSLEDIRRGLDLYGNVKSEGTVLSDHELNSENLYLEGKLGFRYQSGENRVTSDFSEFQPDQANSMVAEQQNFRPFFHAAGLLRYESDQTFDNQNLVIGPSFYSTNTATDNLLTAFYPFWGVSLTWVDIIKSKELKERGIDQENYWRLQTELEWDFQLGDYFESSLPDWATGLGFIPRVVYSLNHDLPDGAKAIGFDENFYFSGTIYAELEERSIRLGEMPLQLDMVYFRTITGAIAPGGEDDLRFEIGVVVNFVR